MSYSRLAFSRTAFSECHSAEWHSTERHSVCKLTPSKTEKARPAIMLGVFLSRVILASAVFPDVAAPL